MQPLDTAELLARFLLERGKFSASLGRVKYVAFLPDSARRTSVFRTAGLQEDEIWNLGRECVAGVTGKDLYGWGEIAVASVEATGLRVDADDIPDRHANLIGWPDEKEKQRRIAMELERAAKLVCDRA